MHFCTSVGEGSWRLLPGKAPATQQRPTQTAKREMALTRCTSAPRWARAAGGCCRGTLLLRNNVQHKPPNGKWHLPDALLHLGGRGQLAAAAGEGGGDGVREARQAPRHEGGLEGARGGKQLLQLGGTHGGEDALRNKGSSSGMRRFI